MNHKRIAVVGGGAAGLMAAIAAAEGGGQVTLLEPNDRLGKKLNITGKGRCNVTNNCSREELLQNIPRNGRFLYGAFARFDSRDAMAFFEKLGVPLKTERGNRVFPQSDCAFDVSGALRRRCERLGVKWVRDRAVSVDTDGGRVCGVTGQQGTYPAEAVILATGGVSYPATGSTGDGYRMARDLGHEIVLPCGSLVPLVSGDDACRRMQGLALKNVELTALNGKNKVQFRDFGELLFIHFGLSGPTILSASAHLHPMEPGKYTVHIDLKPALSEQQLDARLLRELEAHKNKIFANSLEELLPQKLIPVAVERSGIPGETRCHSVTKEQRRALLGLLKDFPVEVEGFRPLAEAIVTSGGVSLREISPKTMESKLVGGLYVAGELLDADAYTGGYNLQIAFATGKLAGSSAQCLGSQSAGVAPRAIRA